MITNNHGFARLARTPNLPPSAQRTREAEPCNGDVVKARCVHASPGASRWGGPGLDLDIRSTDRTLNVKYAHYGVTRVPVKLKTPKTNPPPSRGSAVKPRKSVTVIVPVTCVRFDANVAV